MGSEKGCYFMILAALNSLNRFFDLRPLSGPISYLDYAKTAYHTLMCLFSSLSAILRPLAAILDFAGGSMFLIESKKKYLA